MVHSPNSWNFNMEFIQTIADKLYSSRTVKYYA